MFQIRRCSLYHNVANCQKNRKTKPGEKPIALSDGLGLELRISPNGSKVWKIPAERMKMERAHQVPLPSQAISILHELYALTGRYRLLFPGRNDSTKPISDPALGMALKRMDCDGRHVPHGTRHVVATGLKEMGYPREWIEMQLSHKLPGIEGVYTHAEHMAAEQRPAMMQAWANWLHSLDQSGADP